MQENAPNMLLTGSRPAHLQQYITVTIATLGGLAMGTIIGYSSPAMTQLKGSNSTDCSLPGGDPLSESELSWFSSILNVGALTGALVGGVGINKIGRRGTMLASLIPFLLGWILLAAGDNFTMLLCGRIFCGFCCGLVSLSIPTYVGEISSPDIRGLLGTGFQVMVVTGILFAYIFGAFMCWQWLALVCLLPAIAFAIGMFFCKESPTFLLIKDKEQCARSALTYFRGKPYNIEPEMARLQQSVTEAQTNRASLRDFMQPHVMKPVFISLMLMIFQQLCGINAILFNLTTIFEEAHSSISPDVASIIVGFVQLVASVTGGMLMDKAGRKILLMLSSAAMCISLVSMGVYFYLDEQKKDVSNIGWLPLVSLMVFIAFFSIGFGPIPWLIMGELFTADIREVASSGATFINWFFAFLVTLLFKPVQTAIKNSGVYWLFAAICAVSFFFSMFVVKETKGKTIEEITAMFGGPSVTKKPRNSSLEGYTNHI